MQDIFGDPQDMLEKYEENRRAKKREEEEDLDEDLADDEDEGADLQVGFIPSIGLKSQPENWDKSGMSLFCKGCAPVTAFMHASKEDLSLLTGP